MITQILSIVSSLAVAVFGFVITSKLNASDEKREKLRNEMAERDYKACNLLIAISEATSLTLSALKGQKLNGNVDRSNKKVEKAANEYKDHLLKTANEHFTNGL